MHPSVNINKPHALLSVSDKTHIIEFATKLVEHGYNILSTGGTYKVLKDNNINVIEVATYTDFPEMMAGRVKTLHPKIHGGILARRDIDHNVMLAHDIVTIDIVAVNLYPFAQTIADPNVSMEDAIENIDIGGPAMVRSAAKNHKSVAVITDPDDYQIIITELENFKDISDTTKYDLAVKAFEHTANYDGMVANFLGRRTLSGNPTSEFSNTINLQFKKCEELRYGENPHQSAAFYTEHNTSHDNEASISTATQLQGKALSYNNIADTDAALECVKSFSEPACVIVKHANPCGVAINESQPDAYLTAFNTDSESSFGGIIAFNRPLEVATAQKIIDQQFVEVIIAPSIEEGVLEITKLKKNVRVLTCGELPIPENRKSQLDYKRVNAGLLVQEQDIDTIAMGDLTIVSNVQPTKAQLTDLLFSWKVCQYVKSNAIIYALNSRTIGIGAGQMSRVNSARIATIKAEHAGLATEGAVMASDAFFPFRDGIDNAAAAGIKAIIQPGGSIRDEEIIAAANEHGIAMVFTGVRHFRH